MACRSTNTKIGCYNCIYPKEIAIIMFTENILDHGTFPFARTTCPYNHKNDILFDILQFQKQAAVLRSIRYGRAHQYV